ncbi:Kinase D-interacting substrate [Tolypocladium ophioglossoides CBS 100239]|uniref:Kinase D-interacting substrate n=1 Tax=Tolypocladium ophioglossoides (strain CBS 100239) TaxID=1163406 RepID=A0A0L0MXW9_TOLOC|nr:Kinase D-interacting substrate [Tolypocladium ophioglossoides CBS 100239]
MGELKQRINSRLKIWSRNPSPSPSPVPTLMPSSSSVALAGRLAQDDAAIATPAQQIPRQDGLSPQCSTIPLLNPAPSVPQAAILADTRCDDTDIWAGAFGIVQDREPKIMENYKAYLDSPREDSSVNEGISKPHAAKDIIARLLDERESNQWRLWGTEIKIREPAEKLVKFAIWASPIVKDAVSAQPYAALAWSGVSMLLPLLTRSTTQHEEMIQGLTSMADFQVYWRVSEETYLSESYGKEYQELLAPLAKVYSYIIEYHARVICHLYKPTTHRAWNNITGSDWSVAKVKSSSDECEKLISPLKQRELRESWKLQLKEMQESQEILRQVCRIMEHGCEQQQRHYHDKMERELMEALASTYEDAKNFNPERVKGTCEWFFKDDRFTEWRDSNASTVLWVSAGPGCGKSVLSRALIDEHRLSTSLTASTICYFFFKDDDKQRTGHTDALRAIVHQILTQDRTGDLIQSALPVFRDFGKDLSTNFAALWRIFQQCTRLSDSANIICVLDALGECNDGGESLVHHIEKFCTDRNKTSTSLPNVKFLITSRPYDEQEGYFENKFDSSAYIAFDGDEKSADIGREIDLVIDFKVGNICKGLRQQDRDAIAERLKAMDNRTYLWLYLTFEIIGKNRSRFQQPTHFERLLRGLPSKVSEAYERILCKNQNGDDTRVLLQIVLASARPLSIDEANVAFNLALADSPPTTHDELISQCWSSKAELPLFIKNLCGHFISVHDKKLSFIHKTAKDSFCTTSVKASGKSQPPTAADQSRQDARALCDMKKRSKSPWLEAHGPDIVQAGCLGLELVVQDILLDCDSTKTHGSYYQHAVCQASLLGHTRTVQALLNHVTDDDIRQDCLIAGMDAASHGRNRALVELLLDYDADITSKIAAAGIGGACDRGDRALVEFLLGYGADVNLPPKAADGTISLATATIRGNDEIVRILLEKGAEVNIQDNEGRTPLHWASAFGDTKIVEMLLSNGANANCSAPTLGTSLQVAQAYNRLEVAQRLLDHGVDVNIAGGSHGSALLAATEGGHTEFVPKLLDEGADIHIQADDFITALPMAAQLGNAELVRTFLALSANADVDKQIQDNGTALWLASLEGNKEVVQLLLDTSVGIRVSDYNLALEKSMEEENEDVTQLLRDWKANSSQN